MLQSIIALLAASTTLVDAAFPNYNYKTEKFQSPTFKVHRYHGGKTVPGSLFLAMIHPVIPELNGPFITKNDGELIWHGASKYEGYYNFQPQKLGGVERLTYWTGFLDYSGHGYGQVEVLDKTYNRIKKICFPPSVNIVVPRPEQYPGNTKNPCYVDKHESIATDRNSIIVTAYNATQTDLRKLGGPKDGWVYDCLFFELDLDTNEVLFQWSALDHVPVTKSNFLNATNSKHPLFINGKHFGEARTAPWDFFHINSVQPIPGGYLVNSRMTWSFYKVNGKTGKLEWTLNGNQGGDFKHLDPIFFSWQHNPRLESISKDGKELNVHLFNNDNIPTLAEGKNTSSGYMLHINEKTKTVRSRYNLNTFPTGGVYSVAEGSQQTLPNGHHLMGYGSQAFIQEYNAKNKLIYQAQFAFRTETTHSYRAYRHRWSATPSSKPKVVASIKKSKMHIHMSWNGATEYEAWNVYAGPSKDALKLIKKNAKKKGFETSIAPKAMDSYQFVQVEALDGKGNSMRKSRKVAVSGASPSNNGGAGLLEHGQEGSLLPPVVG